jgi:ABC-type spermidine/putrescine transport system permease subunit I
MAGATTGHLPAAGLSAGAVYFARGQPQESSISAGDSAVLDQLSGAAYAWMFLLRDTGLINTALQHLGLIHDPLPLLYNDGAVMLGLVYGYLPFMVLPVYATLERLDPALVEAAADLGAKPWPTLLHVILPLSAPGIRAGSILVFIPAWARI